MTRLDATIGSVLSRGEFCHVAARTDRGPHLTPMVFAVSGGSVWVTTSRASAKARAWRSDRSVGGLVVVGDEAVSFTGTTRGYDLLDAATWPDVVARSAVVTAASLRFSAKNARFFAGYAVDARHVPFAWTPPGRLFVEIRVADATLLRDGAVVVSGADAGAGAPVASRAAFRSVRGANALAAPPGHVRRALGGSGRGALALEGERAPAVLPVRWAAGEGAILASVPLETLALAASDAAAPRSAALAIDRASGWRARGMLGCMVQGGADVFVPSAVRSGRRALASAIERTGGDADRDALVRLRPARVVWWQGWTSGSANVA
jgi:hypothetical protein